MIRHSALNEDLLGTGERSSLAARITPVATPAHVLG